LSDNGMSEIDTAGRSPEPSMSNSDRLLQHLKPDTLAAQLVQAHKDTDDPLKGLKQVLMERLELVRQALGGVKI
jgi:hypothetical protein